MSQLQPTGNPAPTIVPNPEMEATFYGITVCSLGEDGDMLALGHHSPRHALAAFNRYTREVVGLANLADDRKALAADWLTQITSTRAVFRKPYPNDPYEDEWTWVADWSDPAHPDARPVTLLEI